MIDLFQIQPGDRLVLVGGATGVAVENFGDGQWVSFRADGADPEEEPELVHSQDITAHEAGAR